MTVSVRQLASQRWPTRLNSESAGFLPLTPVPVASPAVRDCLRRQLRRQDVDGLAGRRVWVPRVALLVLVHQQTAADGWACTVAEAVGSPERLPVGVLSLSTVELTRALPSTDAVWWTMEEFGAAWQVQVIDRGIPLDFTTAVIEATNRIDRSVDLREPGLLRRSGCRVAAGFTRRCEQLLDMGALRTTDTGPDRVELVLPGPVWTW